MCRMSFKVSRAPGRGAGGCAFGLPSSARRGRQPVKCSVTFSGLGSYLVFTFFFFFLGETGVFEGGRKENGSVLPGLWGALGVLLWQPMEPVLSTADTPERTRGWCCINGEPP